MANLKWRVAVPVFLLFLALPAADWRREASALIQKEGEYPRLVESLQKAYPDLSQAEQAAVSVIIGYCHSRLRDPQAELFWMKRYLEELRAAKVELGFLPPAARQKVLAFRTSWRNEFPVLWELAPAAEHEEIAFYDPPAELKLRVQASLACDYRLLARDGAELAGGVLGTGVETVRLKVPPGFFATASHPFRLLLTLRSAPERTIEKYFALELQYLVPENAVFDAASGELTLAGRERLPESETQTRVISRRTRFDKALFKKTVLKDLLIGAGFFVVNATLLTSTIDSPDASLFARSSLYGMRRAFTLAGIGFSLSALSRLPKVFRRERIVEEKTLELPEAREANESLERDLAQARKGVRVRLAVKAI